MCALSTFRPSMTPNKIVANGGTIVVPKMPIPGVAWLVYAKDTEGNIFGIHQEDASAG